MRMFGTKAQFVQGPALLVAGQIDLQIEPASNFFAQAKERSSHDALSRAKKSQHGGERF